jgi:hypothetical protein
MDVQTTDRIDDEKKTSELSIWLLLLKLSQRSPQGLGRRDGQLISQAATQLVHSALLLNSLPSLVDH